MFFYFVIIKVGKTGVERRTLSNRLVLVDSRATAAAAKRSSTESATNVNRTILLVVFFFDIILKNFKAREGSVTSSETKACS